MNQPDSNYDVVIVGGGPVGLFLANLLHEYLSNQHENIKSSPSCYRILVLERSPTISRISKAIAMHARTIEGFASLGPQANIPDIVLNQPALDPNDQSLSVAAIPRFFQFYDTTSLIFRFNLPSPALLQTPFVQILFRPQYHTEQILLNELRRRQQQQQSCCHIRIDFSTEVTDISYDDTNSSSQFPVVVKSIHHQITNEQSNSTPSSHTNTVHTKYIIGCDGGRSSVRRLMGIEFSGCARSDYLWMIDARIVTTDGRPTQFIPTNCGITAFTCSNGLMMMLALQSDSNTPTPGLLRIIFTGGDEMAIELLGSINAAMEGEQQVGETDDGYISKQTGSTSSNVASMTPKLSVLELMFNMRCKLPWSKVLLNEQDIQPNDDKQTGYKLIDAAWRTRFRVNERVASQYIKCFNNDISQLPRVILAGDACHVHSPMGGQGMNLGLQDAHNLAWKLCTVLLNRVNHPKQVLTSYEIERRPIAETIVRNTSYSTYFVNSRLLHLVIKWVIPILNHFFPNLISPELVASGCGLQITYNPNVMDTWLDHDINSRFITSSNGIKFKYSIGHRAPTRGYLVPYIITTESNTLSSLTNGNCVTPLDLIVSSGLAWTIFVLMPITSMNNTTTSFALSEKFITGASPLLRVHYIGLLTMPPERVHPLDIPSKPCFISGNALDNNKNNMLSSDQDRHIISQVQVVPNSCYHWIDSDGSVAKFIFNIVHHPDFGTTTEQPSWILLIRPDGYIAMGGLGITANEIESYMMCHFQ